MKSGEIKTHIVQAIIALHKQYECEDEEKCDLVDPDDMCTVCELSYFLVKSSKVVEALSIQAMMSKLDEQCGS